jgi:hypothetical protein
MRVLRMMAMFADNQTACQIEAPGPSGDTGSNGRLLLIFKGRQLEV